jgi:hypothetical protein
MAYQRPVNRSPLSKPEKIALLKQYIDHYQNLVSTDPSVLNRKVPRQVFSDLIERLSETLLAESMNLASIKGSIRTFLDENPLPEALAERLPDDFRVFCLALNALKQWVAAEQAATDRYLLGGVARDLCRESTDVCLVTGIALGADYELHHPLRDGRPPIPLSKGGHSTIEHQTTFEGDDPIGQALVALRRESNRSWAHLRRGCLDLLGRPEPGLSRNSIANTRTFARKAALCANTDYEEILNWMNRKECKKAPLVCR